MLCAGCQGEIEGFPVTFTCSRCGGNAVYHHGCIPLDVDGEADLARIICLNHNVTPDPPSTPATQCEIEGCGKAVLLQECGECHHSFCWRHKKGATKGHDCAGFLRGPSSGTSSSSQSKRRDFEEADREAETLGSTPVLSLKRQMCQKLDLDRTVSLSRQPLRIIYVYDQDIELSAFADPEDDAIVYQWFVDGSLKGEGNPWSGRFKPQAVADERRQEYTVKVKAIWPDDKYKEASVQIRVAQENVIGSANVGQSTAEIQAAFLGQVTAKGQYFQTPPTAFKSGSAIDPGGVLDRRLIFNGALGADMATIGVTGQLVDQVQIGPRAFTFDQEAFSSMLRHELLHCEQMSHIRTGGNFWAALCDRDLGMTPEHLRQFMEVEAYLVYLEDPAVSFFFLSGYGVFDSFCLNFKNAKAALVDLQNVSPYASKAAEFLQAIQARAVGAFPELEAPEDYEDTSH